MNVLKQIVTVLGVITIGMYLAYEHVLSDEQREEMRAVSEEISKAWNEVSDAISPLVKKGPTHAEERAAVEANQERTRQQWEAIGY